MGNPMGVPVAVVALVGESTLGRRGPELNSLLACLARKALRVSAVVSGFPEFPAEPPKDTEGRPLPFDGVNWTISHKPGCVAAAISTGRIGIDVEEVRPRSESLLDYVMNRDEWGVFGSRGDWDSFFRAWTAKEAVLKALGIGLAGLSRCRVSGLAGNGLKMAWTHDPGHLPVPWRVSHLRIPDHIASVTVEPGNGIARWLVVDRTFLDRVSII